jgi:hypothetical protein
VLDARLATLLFKRITVSKSKEVKTGWNLTESSKEGDGSKGGFINDDDDDDYDYDDDDLTDINVYYIKFDNFSYIKCLENYSVIETVI